MEDDENQAAVDDDLRIAGRSLLLDPLAGCRRNVEWENAAFRMEAASDE